MWYKNWNQFGYPTFNPTTFEDISLHKFDFLLTSRVFVRLDDYTGKEKMTFFEVFHFTNKTELKIAKFLE